MALTAGINLVDLLLHLFCSIRDVNRIVKRLRHFVLAVNANQATNYSYIRIWYGEDSACFNMVIIFNCAGYIAIKLIKSSRYFPRKF